MESFLDAPMYKRAISNDQSDVVTHFDDFVASDKSIYRKKNSVSKNSQNCAQHRYFYNFLLLFYGVILQEFYSKIN